MTTTHDIFPAPLWIARSSARASETLETPSVEAAPQGASDTAKAGSFPWETIGTLLVLIFAIALAGLWSWSFAEFVRLMVETSLQIVGAEIFVQ